MAPTFDPIKTPQTDCFGPSTFSVKSGIIPVFSALCVGLQHFSSKVFLAGLFTLAIVQHGRSQTDLAPGDIMFTGYDSDAPDAFSFVLLNDVVSGTVIYITDWGWTNATGFRVDNGGEGLIELTFNAAYPCGTEVIFTDSEDANDWDNPLNQSGIVVGTVVIISSGGANGPELITTGDQLFIYQSPTPTGPDQSSFITAINMNGAWSGLSNSDDNSAQPNGLEDGQVVAFNAELDNVKYDCSPNVGNGDFLRSFITNENPAGWLRPDAANNWAESDNYISLNTPCNFCCTSLSLTGPDIVSASSTFTIHIDGTLPMGESWQLYTAGCGAGSPLQTTMADSFNITASASEGNVTYYVRPSSTTECPNQCVFISICVENTPLAICTNCTANPEICGDCLMPDIDPNPDLDSGCFEIKLIFILDESGSIINPVNYADSVENGVLGFLDALNGQDIQMALIEFSSLARLVTDYTPINNALIGQMTGYFNGVPFNGHTYAPSGGTNWHDAMIKADALTPSDILMFFTDGVPTVYNTTGADCGNGGSTQTPEIVNPVKLANKLKAEDTHMFMLGVGSGINDENLSFMSGPEEYEAGVNTIGTSDYSIGNFGDLAEDLSEFVAELCFSPLDIEKEVYGAVCDGVQQFAFIIHNPGTESAVTVIRVQDTFPSGYNNIQYFGDPFIKLCIGAACESQGDTIPANAFIWTTNSLPPGESDTLILSADVLPTGNYTNIAWASASNAAPVSDTVTSPLFVDDLDPVITCPPGVTIDCSESTLPANTGFATAIDPDGSEPEVLYQDVTTAGICPVLYIIARSWEARDGCNNTVGCPQTIIVEDITPPLMTCPSNVTIGCTASTLPAATGQATSTDLCDSNLSLTYSDATVAGSCPQEYVIHRTWTSTDDCANSATCAQVISIDDNLGPTLTCPASVTISCTASTLPANTGTATATDACDGSPAITFTDIRINGSCTYKFTVQRTWRAQDDCGTQSTCLQTIVVNDNVGPAITCPANVTINCGESTTPSNTGNASGTDVCSGAASISYVDYMENAPFPGSEMRWVFMPAGSTAGTCTSGTNCSTGTICFGLQYTPNVTGTLTSYTTGFIVDCYNGNSPIVSNTSCRMTNNSNLLNDCGGSGTVLMNSSGQNGSLAVTQNVPVILHQVCLQLGAGATILMEEDVITNLTTSIDLPGGGFVSETPAFNDYTIDFDAYCGTSCFYPSTIYRKFIATDLCGNKSTCVQEIAIEDVDSPGITCPPNITISCTASTLPANTGSPLTSDACDGAPVVTYMDVSTASPGCPQEYTITRTWQVTDDCGNFSNCIQTIVIDDSLGPVVTCPPNITVECTASTLPANTGSATATDNCDPSLVFIYTDVTVAGGCPQEYTITRSWRATDDCGNFTVCNQIIAVDDSTPPAITCPSNVTIQCTASTLPANTGSATGTDTCDPTPAITYTDVTTAGACAQAYTITRTWRVTDDCNNSSTCNQSIVIIDTAAPTVTCPANLTIQCTASTLPANTGSATGTDNCDVTLSITYTDMITGGSCPQAYTITRTWSVVDDCNNATTCNQVIVIIDPVAPVITCPASITIECTASTLPANTGTATASDNCDTGVTISFADANGAPIGCPQQYIITRTWTALDDCGNTSTCNQLITIDDSVVPMLTCPPNMTIECTASTLPSNTGNPTTSDNCDASPNVTYADVTTALPSCPQEYTITRTWTSTDDCGNVNTCNQIITIQDSTSPDITCPADVTILCTASTLPANTGTATATDNCDPAPDLDYFDITMSIPGSDGYLIERTWTAIDACGNDETCLQTITVNNPLDPEILGEPFDTICSGEMVVFEAFNQGIMPITYEWSFGSGSSPSSAMGIGPHNVTYTYNGSNGTVGAFVVLTVTTPGCPPVTDTVANINVNAIPNANITSPGGNPCVLQDKTFQPQAPEVPGYTYLWNFGSGASIPNATGYGPHTLFYFTAGPKIVKLIVHSNEDGSSCIDSSTFSFTVNTCAGQITGRVFLNTNTSDTTGIANVNVRLFADQNLDGVQDNSTIIKNVFTNSTGQYSMASVVPGYYVIVQTQPNGYFSLWDDDTSEDFDSLSNLNPNDNIIPVTIEPSEIDTRNFFVEVTNPGIITGYVFEDFNGSQTPQAAEGIPGTVVELHTDNNANGIADPGGLVATVTTNGIGFYTFGGLNTGDYVVVEIQPGGYNNVKDFDPTPDGDNVVNSDMTNDVIPVTVSSSETDAENYFIDISPCGELVTTTEDDVPGSLRALIECTAENDTIGFHPSLVNQVLHITEGRIEINKNIYIHSNLSPPVMIQSDVNGAFLIQSGKTVEFKNIHFTSGLSGFPGVAFEIFGHLILWDVQVFPNSLLLPGNYLIYNQSTGTLTVKGMFRVNQD